MILKVDMIRCYAYEKVLYVSQQDIADSTPSIAIQKALDEARDNATDNTTYYVKVEGGIYEIDTAIRIYSNTTLDVTGVELVKSNKTNILRVGAYNLYSDDNGYMGYYYKNVAIIGGIFNGNYYSGTIIKVGHCKNFSMKKCILQNDYNGHEMEVAGVDGFYIDNCVFKDQIIDKSSSAVCFEAIQLDVLYSKHINGFRSQALPCKNIKIENTVFDNVPRGIGSHTAIHNAPVDGIEISNCSFSNLNSAAIQGQGWVNCTISNNTIRNASRGIALFAIRSNGRGTYLSTVIDNEGRNVSNIPTIYKQDNNQNIQILDNVIILSGYSDAYTDYEVAGIQLFGYNISYIQYNSDNSGGLPIGKYYISDVTIKDNSIITTGCGILLRNVVDAKIQSNKIIHKSGFLEENVLDGIHIFGGSKNITIEKNVLQYGKENAIYVEKSEVDRIAYNVIEMFDGRGIWLNKKAVCRESIYENKLDTCKAGGIKVSTKSDCNKLYLNSISNISGASAIAVNDSSKAFQINENKITINGKSNSADYVDGIKISDCSSCDSIEANRITTPKNKYYVGKGISVREDSIVQNVCNNTISNIYSNGIYITSVRNNMEILNNSIEKVKKDAIFIETSKNYVISVKENELKGHKDYAGIRVLRGNIFLKNNTISNVSRGIFMNAAVKGVIFSNSINKVYKDKVYASRYEGKGYRTNQVAPAIMEVDSEYGQIKIKWKEIKGFTSFEIYYSTDPDFAEKTTTKVLVSGDKKSKTIKDLTPNQKYYVRIRGCKRCNGSLSIFSAYSKTKSIRVEDFE